MRSALFLAVLAGCSDYNITDTTETPGLEDSDTDDGAVAGGQPDIEVFPTSLDFGYSPIDCPIALDLTIRNVGDEDLVVSGGEFDGVGAGAFRVDLSEVGTLAPEEEKVVEVTFTPGTWNDFTANLEIDSNDPDESPALVPTEGIGAEDEVNEDMFQQPAPEKVDILWVIDNSGSMSEEVQQLQNSFDQFMQVFTSYDLDYQIGVVTTDMSDTVNQSGKLQGSPRIISEATSADPIAGFLANSNLGTGGSADERGIDAAYAALTDPLISDYNAGMLRDDAVLAVIILSDEEDSSTMSPTAFADWLDDLKGDPALTSMSAIVGDPSKMAGGTGFGGCNNFKSGTSATAGDDYVIAADKTGGMWGDICSLDFDAVATYLSFVAAGLSTEFALTEEPATVGGITVTVDGLEIALDPSDGWTYDSATNSIVFHGDSIPGPESVILVTYPVASECM